MLKLAAMIHNPGEPAIESRYHDPAVLAEMGYDGRVLYETTALSGVPGPGVLTDRELRRWVEGTVDQVSSAVERARGAGLGVYLFYDVLVLARDLVQGGDGTLTCRNRPHVLCPASEGALALSMQGLDWMLDRWPASDGVVLRFGDTDASRLPHLLGNDLYTPHCPRCSQFGRADRIVAVIEEAYERVVTRRGKRLIVRAWNVRPQGMHDSVELAKRIVARLPGDKADDRLVLSFKFTQTDFWRYQPWNPASLATEGRPVIYELQCQREFEGKGGVPDWQGRLWAEGPPESRRSGEPAGLAEVASRVNFHGVLAWVRGGGWGGPFITDESWVDCNVFAAPRLAEQPDADPATLARSWAERRVGEHQHEAASAIASILERSAEMVRKAFYIEPLARAKGDPWHPAGDWLSDDLLDAEAAWRIVQRLPADKLDAAVQEKRDAAALASSMRHELQLAASRRAGGQLDPLVNSLLYTESLVEALAELIAGLVAYRKWQRSRLPADAETARRGLRQCQSHWNHHTQRHTTMRGAATAFRERGLWELTQRLLGELG